MRKTIANNNELRKNSKVLQIVLKKCYKRNIKRSRKITNIDLR